MWKKIGFSVLGLGLVAGIIVGWFFGLIDRTGQAELKALRPEQLPYVNRMVEEQRGRILAVVTSQSTMGESGKRTGYEHTELARAYYVFSVNGFEVDIASPLGGTPTAIVDNDDMGALDFAFLNDPVAQQKLADTLQVSQVVAERYDAIYFVGGKGTMWDFPDNPHIQQLVRDHVDQNRLIGAVCHGPAALVNVDLKDGTPFLRGRAVTGFSNDEEMLLIPDARTVFPFLLEDRLRERGGIVENGPRYLENVVVADGLVTGQNPWSVYATAEAMVQKLGYTPVDREITGDENSVEVLLVFHDRGKVAAREAIDRMADDDAIFNRNLLIVHGLVAGMQWKLKEAAELLVIAQYMKSMQGST